MGCAIPSWLKNVTREGRAAQPPLCLLTTTHSRAASSRTSVLLLSHPACGSSGKPWIWCRCSPWAQDTAPLPTRKSRPRATQLRGDPFAYLSTRRGETHPKERHFHPHFLQKVLPCSSIVVNPPCRGSKVLNLRVYLLY